MQFHILERLKEINSSLGPLLNEFGLRAKYDVGREGPSIIFISRNGDWVSPVEVILSAKAMGEDGEASWDECYLRIEQYAVYPVSSDGWTCCEWIDTERSDRLGGLTKKTMKAISHAIKEHGVVPTGDRHERVTYNHDFGRAFDTVQEETSRYGFSGITCEQNGDAMSYKFTNLTGSDWQIQFLHGKVTILIDSDVVAECSSHDSTHVGRVISNAFYGFASKNRGLS